MINKLSHHDHDWKWLRNVVFKNKSETQLVTWTLGIWFLKSRQRGLLCIVPSDANCVSDYDQWSPITMGSDRMMNCALQIESTRIFSVISQVIKAAKCIYVRVIYIRTYIWTKQIIHYSQFFNNTNIL